MDADLKRDLCKRYGYSVEYLHYWLAHPTCEACGKQESALPHHIRTRASGGKDTNINLLALCFVCHGAWHAEGWSRFAEKNGYLNEKIEKAREERKW